MSDTLDRDVALKVPNDKDSQAMSPFSFRSHVS